MTKDKYFKQVKCPDCTWSQYQDSEPCAMTPCDRCNSTGYILVPVDKPKPDISPYEIPHVAYDKYFEPYPGMGFPDGVAGTAGELAIGNPIWDFSHEDETTTVEPPADRVEAVKKLLLAYYQADYYPNIRDDYAKEICSLFEPISDEECQERVERIKGEIERKSWNTPYISIDEQLAGKEPVVYREVKMEEAQWQSLWDRGLK